MISDRITVILLKLFIIQRLLHRLQAAYPFESCTDGFTPHGGCTTIQKDGAIGQQSVNTVLLNKGYLELGSKSGCPYVADACQNGFQYYGWVKFHSYPTPCSDFGVVVSTGQFSIQISGNGRLAAHVWMSKDREWYAETPQPVLLKIWYPIIVQFVYEAKSQTGSLRIIMQDQLSAVQNCSRQRTYTPPTKNFVFGGDGAGGHYANVQLDRTEIDSPSKDTKNLIGFLVDFNARKTNCVNKNRATLSRPFTCFYLENGPLNWTQAYDSCNSTSYVAGYPYGRLARFDSNNFSSWDSVVKTLSSAGVLQAWLGGGKQGHYLNKTMSPVGTVTAPPDVTVNNSQNADQCMMLNTASKPWQWAEAACNSSKKFLCEMSWDCLVENPCKNLGGCIPVTVGPKCQCFDGTSGTFCESGRLKPTCVNSCPCSEPPIYQCEATPTPASVTATSPTTATSFTTATSPTTTTNPTTATSPTTETSAPISATSTLTSATPSATSVAISNPTSASESTTSAATQTSQEPITQSRTLPQTQPVSVTTATPAEPPTAPTLPPATTDPELAECAEKYKSLTVEETTTLTSIEEYMKQESVEYDYSWENTWKLEFDRRWQLQKLGSAKNHDRKLRRASSESAEEGDSNSAFKLSLKSRFNERIIEHRRRYIKIHKKVIIERISTLIKETETKRTMITRENCVTKMESLYEKSTEIKRYWEKFFEEMTYSETEYFTRISEKQGFSGQDELFSNQGHESNQSRSELNEKTEHESSSSNSSSVISSSSSSSSSSKVESFGETKSESSQSSSNSSSDSKFDRLAQFGTHSISGAGKHKRRRKSRKEKSDRE